MTKRNRLILSKAAGIAVAVILLAVLFYWRARQNLLHHDYINSNFFSYWLSGRMVWTGEDPYDTNQWLSNFNKYGAAYQPSKTFQYPLPIMYLMAPLGLLPAGEAYFALQIITQVTIAVVAYVLSQKWEERSRKILLLPLIVFMLFFGPVYLTLQLGSISVLALLWIFLSAILFEKGKPLLAGLFLSLTLLKPPQGFPLIALAGIWLLAKRDWKAIAGIFLGGLALLAVWLIRDPHSLAVFSGSSSTLLSETLGFQSNAFSFAYLACNQNSACMWIAGSGGALLGLGLGAFYLWKKRDQLTAWTAFNIIIPMGFVSTLYLWSYDQLPYVMPIVWIAGRLIERTRSYLYVFLFLAALDAFSIVSLLAQAYTKKDLLSVINTALILGLSLWLMQWKQQPIDKPPAHA
jgi:hypothetical protein